MLSVIASTFLTIVLTPPLRRLGERLNIIDNPNERKQHKKPLVRIGGIAIFIGFFLALLFSIVLSGDWLSILNYKIFLIAIGGAFSFFLIGLFDDLFEISPFYRLFFQVLLAIILWGFDIRVQVIDLSWLSSNIEIISIPDFFSLLITVIWIVGVTNSINWLDGLDGLASTILSINSIALIIICLSFNNYLFALYSAALLGSSLGFLRYNCQPALILMGDCGSYFLGFSLSIISIIGLSKENLGLNPLLALLILFIPLADMVFVILNRLKSGRSPFHPDRSHIHHRMLAKGISLNKSLLTICSGSLCSSSLALFIALK
ncbi:Undecaprenyl-phosphate N-acetylglucosaminyl 1-phosphate transferase [Prochlorococcus sp. MIT 0602]|uniref:MraY family glycosyltransferase n=1 Tax=unclassified Prochlorococcus TaxID=2627481 RepID=UPI000533B266|nr:MraY family glycosyltransferase [Prochlorococcus sp. MIT 0602]KGG17912.1 Undecaprenyl-phosphate N-acetylglucosaminyl 1-phosphate transferase [Prochlorococcus sp. MIT 0602]